VKRDGDDARIAEKLMWYYLHWMICGSFGGHFALLLIGNRLLLIETKRAKKPSSLVCPFFCGPVCALSCWWLGV
jgi:hypothetical protein